LLSMGFVSSDMSGCRASVFKMGLS
jgi:hypothetical protein